MRFRKSTFIVLVFSLLLAVFAVALAQNSTQNTQKKQAVEACCSMEDCCCKGGSCPMKEGAEAKDGCCCSGDSCEMKSDDMKNHSAHEGSCCADSSDPKMKEKMKNHGDDCCCKAKMKNKEMKHKTKH